MANVNQRQPQPNARNSDQITRLFHTQLYDYFYKAKMYGCARVLRDSAQFTIDQNLLRGGGLRQDGGLRGNGVDKNGLDADPLSKDDNSDLEPPTDHSANPLFEWFSIFWELQHARQGSTTSSDAMAYIAQTTVSLRALQHY
jgi:hypothetical protein